VRLYSFYINFEIDRHLKLLYVSYQLQSYLNSLLEFKNKYRQAMLLSTTDKLNDLDSSQLLLHAFFYSIFSIK